MIRLFHAFLLGLIFTAILNGLYWLATSERMPLSHSAPLALGMYLACGLLLEGRRVRERKQLHDLYDLPSHEH